VTSVAIPDVVLVGPEWPTRALLRAQLMEEGYDVVATDSWPIPRQYLRSDAKPRALIVDLHGLPDPHSTLDELRSVLDAGRVVVLTAIGTVEIDSIRKMGFRALRRPVTVGEIVREVAAVLGK
jgi:hypothetical protein